MPRRIITRELQASGESNSIDGYFDRVIKYIPADIVAGWTALTSVLRDGAEGMTDTALWIGFAAFVLLSAAWTWKQTAGPGLPFPRTQVIVAGVSFIVWVFALGEPFATLP